MQSAKPENYPTGSLVSYRAPRTRIWVYGRLCSIDKFGGATVKGLEDGRFYRVNSNEWKPEKG